MRVLFNIGTRWGWKAIAVSINCAGNVSKLKRDNTGLTTMKRLLLTLTLVAGVFAATAANSDPYEKSNLAKDFSQATDQEVNRAAQIDALRYWDLSGEYMTHRDDRAQAHD